MTAKRSPLQPKNWSEASLYDRFRHIEPYVREQTVLDMGCAAGYHRPDWMHKLIHGTATRIVGVDIDEQAIQELQELGYEVILGDAQQVRLSETFSVVFAGEIIEHLDDLRGFLETVRFHLGEDGKLILTTPNVFCFTNFIYRFWGGYRTNRQHTCWFCERTVKHLLERNGFSIIKIEHLPHNTPTFARRISSALVRALLPDRLAWNTLLVVAEYPSLSGECNADRSGQSLG